LTATVLSIIPEGKTVNKESTLTSFIALGMRSKEKHPEEWRTNFVSSSRQCSSTPVDFGQGFILGNNNVETLVRLPYSPDVALADFYLFPRLKSALTGRLFCDATDIF
jgi:hypothetical protein